LNRKYYFLSNWPQTEIGNINSYQAEWPITIDPRPEAYENHAVYFFILL
jgi:hypothetical protein